MNVTERSVFVRVRLAKNMPKDAHLDQINEVIIYNVICLRP